MQTEINVVGLRIKNFLSISEVQIKPGHITQICGSNNQGKTSILKALEIAIKGSSDGSLVKLGESQAEIIVDFSDGLNVRRRINSDGSQNVKVSKNEMESKAPQGFLNSLFENHNFNPLEMLEPKKRQEAILQAVPVRISLEQVKTTLSPLPIDLPPVDYEIHGTKALAQLHDYFYARRAEANKIAKAEQSRFLLEVEKSNKNPPAQSGHDDSEADRVIGACDEEIKVLQQKQGAHNQKVHSLQVLSQNLDKAFAAVNYAKQEFDNACLKYEDLKKQKELAQSEIKDSESIQPAIDAINKTKNLNMSYKIQNAEYRAWEYQQKNLENLKNKADESSKFADELDRCIKSINGPLKDSMTAYVKTAFPGITFEGDRFLYEGYSLDALSTSASIKLACGLARTMAKKSRVICLDGAEALDEESYSLLKQQIENDGFSYFVTKVGEPFKDSEGDTVLKMQEGRVML